MGFQMSYSFNVRAKTRAELLEAISGKLDEVVAAQAIHGLDRKVAEETAAKVLEHVVDPGDDLEFSANMHGSCWAMGGVLQQLSIGVDISLQRPFVATADA
jgi:hypothetical protein